MKQKEEYVLIQLGESGFKFGKFGSLGATLALGFILGII
jgi:hypothetical protein